MRVLQAQGCLAHRSAGLHDRERTVLPQFIGEARAIDVFHCQNWRVACLFGIERGDDVRMVQPGGGLRFAMEALGGPCFGDELGSDYLYRHLPAHDAMFCQPHCPHAPAAEPPQRPITRMVHQCRRQVGAFLVDPVRPGDRCLAERALGHDRGCITCQRVQRIRLRLGRTQQRSERVARDLGDDRLTVGACGNVLIDFVESRMVEPAECECLEVLRLRMLIDEWHDVTFVGDAERASNTLTVRKAFGPVRKMKSFRLRLQRQCAVVQKTCRTG